MVTRLAIGLAGLLLLAAPQDCCAKVRYEGGDGTSFDAAIVVQDAQGEGEGVIAEYVWLKKNYGDWNPRDQSLVSNNDRKYDVIEISKGAETKRVYFDITSFIGK